MDLTPAAVTASSTTVLVSLLVLFVIYFGPPLLRAFLKPERGSTLDLRIAWFETFVNDVEKRTKITEKLARAAKLPVPPPVPETDRTTEPPTVPAPPASRTTEDAVTTEKEGDHG